MVKSNTVISLQLKFTVETNLPVPNPSDTSSAVSSSKSSSSDETSDDIDEENWDFDDPNCRWRPPGQNDEDCGEGVVCPPCG